MELILPEIAVEGFALYSSTTNNEGAQYKIEQRFPLPEHEAQTLPSASIAVFALSGFDAFLQ